jgi:hypothetical protein
MHYCHNCGRRQLLNRGAFCVVCLDFWYAHHRMPVRADFTPKTSLTRIYETMGWNLP